MLVALEELGVKLLQFNEFGVLVLQALLQLHQLVDVDLLALPQLLVLLTEGVDLPLPHFLDAHLRLLVRMMRMMRLGMRLGLLRRMLAGFLVLLGLDGVVGTRAVGVGLQRLLHIRYMCNAKL